jgi:hypothetical protein
LSPILAFFLLNVLTNATAALGAEVTPEMKQTLQQQCYSPFAVKQVISTSKTRKLQPLPAIATMSEL